MDEKKYIFPDAPAYSEDIREIQNLDRVNAKSILNPVLQEIVNHVHAVWLKLKGHIVDTVAHVTTAEREIWNKKVDSEAGKDLMTSEERKKLEGIEARAQVNTVHSVAGKTGAVTLGKSDVGLDKADNTADLDKPISKAVQSALENKADITDGQGFMTDAERKKLEQIEAGANKYVHPATSGNKHIPAGGSSGHVLKWSGAGTADWATETDTTYTAGTAMTLKGTTFHHSDYTGATVGPTANLNPGYSGTFTVPQVTSNLQGHITGLAARTVTMPPAYVHPTSGVPANTYRSVTVDEQGHVTAGTNPVNTVAQGGTGASTVANARANLGVPPISHAGTTTGYGAGSGTNYGHVKLSDSINSSLGTNDGVAATPKAVSDLYGKLHKEDLVSEAEILKKVYPVGSLYLSVTNTNPGTLFGGTWVSWGSGQAVVGVDTAQTEFSAVEKTGGAKTHTLTTSQMPSHTHTQNGHNHTQSAHSHSIGGHTHSISHNHTLNGHTHSISITTGGNGGHTHSLGGTANRVAGTPWNGCVASIRASDRDWTTVSSVGNHTHSVSGTSGGNSGNTSGASASNSGSAAPSCGNTAPAIQNATAVNQNTGGGGAHNNLQPYITCYLWKRTT